MQRIRINWRIAIPFLIIVWGICSIDQSWIAATGWTAIIIGFDVFLAFMNWMFK